jgi:integrase
LTLKQLAILLQSLQEPVKILAITVSMMGLRIDEVLTLCWKNVDFERSLIYVRDAVYEGNLSSPKSKSSIRDIPIGPSLHGRVHLLTHLFLSAEAAHRWTRIIF